MTTGIGMVRPSFRGTTLKMHGDPAGNKVMTRSVELLDREVVESPT